MELRQLDGEGQLLQITDAQRQHRLRRTLRFCEQPCSCGFCPLRKIRPQDDANSVFPLLALDKHSVSTKELKLVHLLNSAPRRCCRR